MAYQTRHPTSHTHSSGYYPPVPSGTDTSKPQYGEPQHQLPAGAPRGHIQAELPRLAPNPWVKDLWSWLAKNTVGVARVDLRRPLIPSTDQYNSNNLLFATYKERNTYHNKQQSIVQWRPFRRGAKRQAQQPPLQMRPPPQPLPPTLQHHPHQPQGYAGAPTATHRGVPAHQPYPPPPTQQPYRPAYPQAPGAYPAVPQPYPTQYNTYPAGEVTATEREETAIVPSLPPPTPSGARVKITRSFVWRNEEDEDKPWADLGAGINIDMDRQRIQPVFRLKVAQIVSLKAYPAPCLKMAKLFPLPNTGMGVKLHYEVPLAELHHFYRPPARLMVRLDPMPGSGVKLSPYGVDMDQQSVKFGKNITMRASAGLAFPRSIPIDPDNDDFGLKVHRLSLKALW